MTPPAWLSNAAQSNLNFALNLQNAGFQPYVGPNGSPFSQQQLESFSMGNDVAAGIRPFVGETGQLVNNYANAPAQTVSANTIASQMGPYMNRYVDLALAPQLELQNQQFAQQNKAFDAGATMAGAYGDTGWNLGRTNLTQQQDLARQGLIGNAYNAAFNTAIGAGAQDVANQLNAATTNANLAETALGRQLTGANVLNSMGTGATNLINTLGGQQTAEQYNQWLMAQQYPFLTTQAVDQAIYAGRAGAPITTSGTSTTEQPDNSGFGILGSIIGSAFNFLPISDPLAKENVEQVGELYDGTPVHRFNYVGNPTTQIGLMAPEVAERTPEAVDESGPLQRVDYDLATRRAAKMARMSHKKRKKPHIQFGIAA